MTDTSCQRAGGGLTKRTFPDRASAKRSARTSQAKFGHKTYVYRCTNCRGFHITSAKPEDRHQHQWLVESWGERCVVCNLIR